MEINRYRFRRFLAERLEPRRVFAFTVSGFDVVAGTVTFSGDKSGTVDDSLILGESGGFLTHNATVGDFADSTDIDPGPGVAHLEVASADHIEVDCGDGNDTVDASAVTDGGVILMGGAGADKLTGSNTSGAIGDVIDGGSGNDVLIGLGGDDQISGGDGEDQIRGGAGNDTLKGGVGNDDIDLGTGLDEVDGGDGLDTMTFSAVAGEFSISASGTNIVIFAAGDGSSTGLFGAANIETVLIASTTANPSVYDLKDLTGTSVQRVGVQLSGGLNSGSELKVEGSSLADHLFVADGSVFSSSNSTVKTKWGTVAFKGGANTKLTVDGLDGDDVIDVASATTFGGTSISVLGGAGNDTINIGAGNLNQLHESVTADGGDGTDSVVVDDAAQSLAVNYKIAAGQLTSNNATNSPTGQPARTFGGVVITAATERLRLDGSQAPNVFDVAPSLSTEVVINGNSPLPGSGTPFAGDFLQLDPTGTSGRHLEIPVPRSGNGRWIFSSGEKPVDFESIERFNHVERFAVAADAGRYSQPIVTVYDAETMDFLFQFTAYEPGYRGGVHVTTGDVDGDGIPDIITAPGRVHEPIVKVFDGSASGSELSEFLAYAPDFNGGVNIAVGDVTGDRVNDIITTPARGISVTRVFENQQQGLSFKEATEFRPFSTSFIGGSTVSVADLNHDGIGDIVVGSGSGMAPTILVFDSKDLRGLPVATLNPFSAGQRGGVNVASSNSVVGNEVVVSPASTTNEAFGLTVLTSASTTATPTFRPQLKQMINVSVSKDENQRASLRASAIDLNQDGIVDAIFAAYGGDGNSRKLHVFRGSPLSELDSFLQSDDWLNDGLYPG